MFEAGYTNNIVYYLAKNGDIRMLKHILKTVPKWTEKALVSYCESHQKLKPLDVALLYNQTKCLEWMQKQTGSKPKIFTDDELMEYLDSLTGFYNSDRSLLYAQLLRAQKAQNRNFGEIFNQSSDHLLKAVRLDDYERVKAILDVGGDPNTIPSSLEAAFTSRQENSTKICKVLLKFNWC